MRPYNIGNNVDNIFRQAHLHKSSRAKKNLVFLFIMKEFEWIVHHAHSFYVFQGQAQKSSSKWLPFFSQKKIETKTT